MIKKITLILISLIMIFAFAGCQLAVEGKGDPNMDALCGMFITFENLSTNESYLNNIDWGAVMNGGTALYQTENMPMFANERTNEYNYKEFYFEGIDGIRMMEVLVHKDGEHEAYWTVCADIRLIETESRTEASSSSENLKLKGTSYVYINPELYDKYGDCIVYYNPIYQDAEGRVYVVPGDGGDLLSSSADSCHRTAGNLVTTTLSGRTTRTVRGKEESWSAEISLAIVGINNIKKYVFKQMDVQDNVISALEITQDSIPEEITLDDNTAYAILEEHSMDVSGKDIVERSIVDTKMESLEVRFPNEKGFALTHSIPLKNIPVSTDNPINRP